VERGRVTRLERGESRRHRCLTFGPVHHAPIIPGARPPLHDKSEP
jgi:hypothetical protein